MGVGEDEGDMVGGEEVEPGAAGVAEEEVGVDVDMVRRRGVVGRVVDTKERGRGGTERAVATAEGVGVRARARTSADVERGLRALSIGWAQWLARLPGDVGVACEASWGRR